MKLTINGEAREVPAEATTVAALLAHLGFSGMRVAVEVNGAIVRRAGWDGAAIAEGDNVEIVQFVGGG